MEEVKQSNAWGGTDTTGRERLLLRPSSQQPRQQQSSQRPHHPGPFIPRVSHPARPSAARQSSRIDVAHRSRALPRLDTRVARDRQAQRLADEAAAFASQHWASMPPTLETTRTPHTSKAAVQEADEEVMQIMMCPLPASDSESGGASASSSSSLALHHSMLSSLRLEGLIAEARASASRELSQSVEQERVLSSGAREEVARACHSRAIESAALMTDLTSRITALETSMADTERKRTDHDAEMTQALTAVRSRQDELASLASHHAELVSSVEALRAENQSLRSTCDSSAREVSSLRAALDSCHESMSSLHEQAQNEWAAMSRRQDGLADEWRAEWTHEREAMREEMHKQMASLPPPPPPPPTQPSPARPPDARDAATMTDDEDAPAAAPEVTDSLPDAPFGPPASQASGAALRTQSVAAASLLASIASSEVPVLPPLPTIAEDCLSAEDDAPAAAAAVEKADTELNESRSSEDASGAVDARHSFPISPPSSIARSSVLADLQSMARQPEDDEEEEQARFDAATNAPDSSLVVDDGEDGVEVAEEEEETDAASLMVIRPSTSIRRSHRRRPATSIASNPTESVRTHSAMSMTTHFTLASASTSVDGGHDAASVPTASISSSSSATPHDRDRAPPTPSPDLARTIFRLSQSSTTDSAAATGDERWEQKMQQIKSLLCDPSGVVPPSTVAWLNSLRDHAGWPICLHAVSHPPILRYLHEIGVDLSLASSAPEEGSKDVARLPVASTALHVALRERRVQSAEYLLIDLNLSASDFLRQDAHKHTAFNAMQSSFKRNPAGHVGAQLKAIVKKWHKKHRHELVEEEKRIEEARKQTGASRPGKRKERDADSSPGTASTESSGVSTRSRDRTSAKGETSNSSASSHRSATTSDSNSPCSPPPPRAGATKRQKVSPTNSNKSIDKAPTAGTTTKTDQHQPPINCMSTIIQRRSMHDSMQAKRISVEEAKGGESAAKNAPSSQHPPLPVIPSTTRTTRLGSLLADSGRRPSVSITLRHRDMTVRESSTTPSTTLTPRRTHGTGAGDAEIIVIDSDASEETTEAKTTVNVTTKENKKTTGSPRVYGKIGAVPQSRLRVPRPKAPSPEVSGGDHDEFAIESLLPPRSHKRKAPPSKSESSKSKRVTPAPVQHSQPSTIRKPPIIARFATAASDKRDTRDTASETKRPVSPRRHTPPAPWQQAHSQSAADFPKRPPPKRRLFSDSDDEQIGMALTMPLGFDTQLADDAPYPFSRPVARYSQVRQPMTSRVRADKPRQERQEPETDNDTDDPFA